MRVQQDNRSPRPNPFEMTLTGPSRLGRGQWPEWADPYRDAYQRFVGLAAISEWGLSL